MAGTHFRYHKRKCNRDNGFEQCRTAGDLPCGFRCHWLRAKNKPARSGSEPVFLVVFQAPGCAV
jgi:hypothetical protein